MLRLACRDEGWKQEALLEGCSTYPDEGDDGGLTKVRDGENTWRRVCMKFKIHKRWSLISHGG